MRIRLQVFSVLALIGSFLPLYADEKAATKVDSRYEIREEHDPNGIGKFYMGREIAHVMGFAGASWLDVPIVKKKNALRF